MLEAWLSADTRHEGAYFRAEAAWAMMDRASVMGAGIAPSDIPDIVLPPTEDTIAPSDFVVPLSARKHQVSASRRALLKTLGGGALAASITAAAAVSFSLKDRISLTTEVGELRKVPLKDRSIASVNTDSRLEIELKPDRRDVRLLKGEAWFDVAKDKTRPFVVTADTVRVRAVGTAFSVRRFDKGAEVLVTEGVVELWNSQDEARPPLRLEAGHKAYMPFATTLAETDFTPAAVDRALAWREGQIALDKDTLQKAVGEFNRYNRQKIIIADPALNQSELVGWFRVDQPETFARAVHGALNVPVSINETRIIIGRP